MKEYCVDLEIAKELKENGFPQNTSFIHIHKFEWIENNEGGIAGKEEVFFWDIEVNKYTEAEHYSAPTSDEILKELPDNIYIGRNSDWYEAEYIDDNGNKVWEIAEQKSSNALAKMWLYLKKEGYIIEK